MIEQCNSVRELHEAATECRRQCPSPGECLTQKMSQKDAALIMGFKVSSLNFVLYNRFFVNLRLKVSISFPEAVASENLSKI